SRVAAAREGWRERLATRGGNGGGGPAGRAPSPRPRPAGECARPRLRGRRHRLPGLPVPLSLLLSVPGALPRGPAARMGAGAVGVALRPMGTAVPGLGATAPPLTCPPPRHRSSVGSWRGRSPCSCSCRAVCWPPRRSPRHPIRLHLRRRATARGFLPSWLHGARLRRAPPVLPFASPLALLHRRGLLLRPVLLPLLLSLLRALSGRAVPAGRRGLERAAARGGKRAA